MLPVTVVHMPAGGQAVELTPIVNTVRFDTAAVGGFGSMEASLPGDVRKRLAYLGITRLFYGSALLWEGQLEDIAINLAGGDLSTKIRCFGLRRLLEETTVRRVWSKRDLDWQQTPFGRGAAAGPGLAVTIADVSVSIGNVEPTDLSLNGVKIAGNGVSIAANGGGSTQYLAPKGVTFTTLLADWVRSSANLSGFVESAQADGTGAAATVYTASATVAQALVASAAWILLGAYNSSGGALTPTSADYGRFTNIRLLGTSLSEDAAGGFYGGTILRDLIALVPGLGVGQIDDGSDFTIQVIERAVRDSARSVVEEVAGYYTREWAVWQDGTFDWRTRNLDEPQWIVPLNSLDSLELQGTTDTIARVVYVLYSDAASGLGAEASATSSSPTNPYVRQGKTKDVLVQPGFPMTSNTSAQLASTLLTDVGQRPAVTGSLSIKATKILTNAVGSARPAAMIRGGDNIYIPELPKTDPFLQGRDGETLFHVVSSDVDLTNGTVTLELEGQQSRQSVILARLAAVTRTLTG
jgi:hypothetical protein